MAEGWKGSGRSFARRERALGPSWEKTFCTSICHVSWERICAAKVMISGYNNIAEWNDSGALEAFTNAKARYWAEISGLSNDIPLPDPNMYIEKIEYNSIIDPELVADLYKQPQPPPPEGNKYEDLSYEAFLNANLSNLPVKATGWGDDEEEDTTKHHSNWDALVEKPLPDTGWADNKKLESFENDGGDIAWSGPSYDNSWQKQRKFVSRSRGGRRKSMEQWKPKAYIK
ncbi:uncharacterized protein A4U43_C04F2850 [Asparagus officinalis]|uniref:Uncharacterized protein n=1 Tax=Asparagus officinalis TaxID=4686 RepID=A0A5P1F0H6_ASPOF|nr:uncharacterized protein LOC109836477 [Asparagus officinalis]ONK70917.1 uncharacterized protein A4U43_C04F2850 [Asparagus officinalis]